MDPYQSRKYRAILDLSFSLIFFGMKVPSVNENTVVTALHHIMRQLGSVIHRLIEAVAQAPLEDDTVVFSKINIKEGYLWMVVEHRYHLNFAYVLPNVDGAWIQLVIPLVLQMGWSHTPRFPVRK